MMGRGSTVPFLANATSVNNTGLVQVLFFFMLFTSNWSFFSSGSPVKCHNFR